MYCPCGAGDLVGCLLVSEHDLLGKAITALDSRGYPDFCHLAISRYAAPRRSRGTLMEAEAALDRAAYGPRWLAQPAVADVVANALCYGEKIGKYRLHAWLVMPNHVHALITPESPFSEIMRWLKWTTGADAR